MEVTGVRVNERRSESGLVIDDMQRPYREIQLFKREPGWSLSRHSHPFYQIILVISGVLCVRCGSDTWYVNRGQAHVLPAGCEHALSSANGYEQLGIDLNVAGADRDVIPLLCDYVPQPAVINCPEALDDIGVLVDRSRIGNRIACARQTLMLDTMVIKLLEAHTRVGAERFDMRLSGYVNSHIADKLSLNAIADEFHMSVPHLERMTRRHFGCGVMELRNTRRLTSAKALLISTSESMSSIAEQLGFCDQAHFSRFFKQRCGISPSDYRQKADGCF